jgi:hypothetical protein
MSKLRQQILKVFDGGSVEESATTRDPIGSSPPTGRKNQNAKLNRIIP